MYATQPGVTAFSGATNNTASRVTALVVSPDCGSKGNGKECTVWVGEAGGGIWRTDRATDPNPEWKQLSVDDLDQASVGVLTLDPTDKKHKTLYLGTGEGNRCSSGCEAGVGIYKSTNGGEKWEKLDDTCVDNATYKCATPGKDAFLGRGINSIVVDPSNANHIFVGSAQAVRGLSHVIGAGGTSRLEPGANEPGLYESTDGGNTFTEVWDGGKPDFGGDSSRSASRMSVSTRRTRPSSTQRRSMPASGGVTPVRRRRRSRRCSSRSSCRRSAIPPRRRHRARSTASTA